MSATSTPRASGLTLTTRASRAALQWRLLLLWAGLLLIPTIVAVIPVWRTLGASLDHAVHAAALAQRLDLMTVADLAANAIRNGAAISQAAIAGVVLALLLSPLLSGLVVTAARAPAPLGFAALLTGAFSEYGRMLRMLLWSIVPLGVALAIGAGALKLADRHAATAILEADADLARHLALLLTGVLFLLACATLDAGRAALAVDRRRTSAVKAWWRGLGMLRRRPLVCLAIYFGITVLGLALYALLGVARLNLAGPGPLALAAGLLATQLAALALAWMRSARLFALIGVKRSIS
ncbi:hypothetical protein IGS59_03890 [Janthinobacterium sp. GW460P]|uniref:hypothetical protein n=1 Tax=unclassified Janthinobacterium TaxID=2610881 RepID=UPI000A31E5E5|nr:MULTISPECIES: hypothetical protein [unclassified Janthinobacterium]MCC7701369.1 hypothetical protein [Janthinobacterium sp. GW460P]MCC7706876.1 hypothetical protein [Janthinobacterium sp. GW460W]